MPDFATIRVTHDDGIGRLVLDRPEVLNALSSTTLTEIADATAWFDDRGCAVVVVSGAGRAFSAGFDLAELADGSPEPHATPTADLGHRMACALSDMRAVAVAAIQGHCVGGGVVLAAACDIRIAATGARFSIPEVDLGIPLAWGGIPRLVRAMGPAATADLVMSCRTVTADEALRLGLVSRVVDDDVLASHTDHLAAGLAAKAPSVLATTKRQIDEAAEALASTRGGWAGSHLISTSLADPDARAAAARYLRGRGR